MGMRKKINQKVAELRKVAKGKRDEKRKKKEAKPMTPGQKLHEVMHGRTK